MRAAVSAAGSCRCPLCGPRLELSLVVYICRGFDLSTYNRARPERTGLLAADLQGKTRPPGPCQKTSDAQIKENTSLDSFTNHAGVFEPGGDFSVVDPSKQAKGLAERLSRTGPITLFWASSAEEALFGLLFAGNPTSPRRPPCPDRQT